MYNVQHQVGVKSFILFCEYRLTLIMSQLAMIISAIVFAQTSVLNFTYFLSTALPLVGVNLG